MPEFGVTNKFPLFRYRTKQAFADQVWKNRLFYCQQKFQRLCRVSAGLVTTPHSLLVTLYPLSFRTLISRVFVATR